ncbi:hypothetical protein CALVIDRAFT_513997 [Calocera viscosa TUFC12733]|uniref:Small ribosomal subunit protein mS41 n=1 Tax=Calocera viscosa (strain TUFC12733) TaxID=1330018 RepID=A0A167MY10_CALVF|nr:hypothetical protein CALVIDRAFT_513997 [Calocera viscosa TUFC12733]
MSLLRPSSLRSFLRPITPLRRSWHGTVSNPIPEPRPEIAMTTPEEFLKAIGHGTVDKVKVETWEGLFKLRGRDMKQAGLGIRERRYVLWALEKFRQGGNPKEFAVPIKPKKTIRGWGPKVQNGKKIR